MILYRKIVAIRGNEALELVLDQLGSVAKPYFLCALEWKGPLVKKQPMAFFLHQTRDATEPIEVTVALAARLLSYPDFEQCLNLAKLLQQGCQWAGEWDKTKALLTG